MRAGLSGEPMWFSDNGINPSGASGTADGRPLHLRGGRSGRESLSLGPLHPAPARRWGRRLPKQRPAEGLVSGCPFPRSEERDPGLREVLLAVCPSRDTLAFSLQGLSADTEGMRGLGQSPLGSFWHFPLPHSQVLPESRAPPVLTDRGQIFQCCGFSS